MVMSSKKIGKMAGADVDKALANISASTPKPDMKADNAEFKKATGPSRDMTFAESFKYARMAAKAVGMDPSKETFTYKGKTYSTRMAGEGGSKATAPKTATSKATPKAAAPKATSSDSPVGNYYRNQFTRDKTGGAASNIKGVSAAESAAAQKKAGKSNVASTGSTTAKDNSFAARQKRKYGGSSPGNVLRAIKDIKDFNDAGLKRDVITDARFKAQQKAKGYAKGGSIDGCAIRGKTRAPMKKGK